MNWLFELLTLLDNYYKKIKDTLASHVESTSSREITQVE